MKRRFQWVAGATAGLAALVLTFGGWQALLDTAPLWPPYVAIALALATQDVVIALYAGVWVGAVIALKPAGAHGLAPAVFSGFFRSLDTHIVAAVADKDHASTILFTLLMGGMVGVVGKAGGLEGFVARFSRALGSRVRAQMGTFLLGAAIFFDDYANCLIVGNTMRPISDQFKVSREKLSFLIDATAAPVTSIFFVSTWIGFELGLIGDGMKELGWNVDPYALFLASIPYRFYVIVILTFIPILIFSRRDFGPMLEAERRAKNDGHVLRPGSEPLSETKSFHARGPADPKRWSLAAVPIGVLILSVIGGLLWSGYNSIAAASGAEAAAEASLRDLLGNANSFQVLLGASLFSGLVAILLSVEQQALTFTKAMHAYTEGMKGMFLALIVLSLAWAIGGVTKQVGTAEYVVSAISHAMPAAWLPAAVFVTSAAIAFATGTSWGTMAILFPIAIPLAAELGPEMHDPAGSMYLMEAVVGTVLSGSIFGDHCSPISDTTIMSSIAASVDHIDHVRTQLVYCLAACGICLLLGYLPAGYGFNPWVLNGLCLAALTGVLYKFGQKV